MRLRSPWNVEVSGRLTTSAGGTSVPATLMWSGRSVDLLDEVAPSSNGPREQLITFVPDRPGHDRRYAIDPSKIERELGWQAAETFETGLAKTVRWYLDNRAWWQAVLDRGYRAERLGLLRKDLSGEIEPRLSL